jgi:hypothetical protein
MEMEVRPVEADLQEDVKIGQGAVGSYEKAPIVERGQAREDRSRIGRDCRSRRVQPRERGNVLNALRR